MKRKILASSLSECFHKSSNLFGQSIEEVVVIPCLCLSWLKTLKTKWNSTEVNSLFFFFTLCGLFTWLVLVILLCWCVTALNVCPVHYIFLNWVFTIETNLQCVKSYIVFLCLFWLFSYFCWAKRGFPYILVEWRTSVFVTMTFNQWLCVIQQGNSFQKHFLKKKKKRHLC